MKVATNAESYEQMLGVIASFIRANVQQKSCLPIYCGIPYESGFQGHDLLLFSCEESRLLNGISIES
jgi:hypothetical protein